jgi:hypothetical protein
LIGGEAEPVEVVAVYHHFAEGAGGIDLAEVGDGVAPEVGPPGGVELVEIVLVMVAEPVAEGVGAEVAAAVFAVFVVDVPEGGGLCSGRRFSR